MAKPKYYLLSLSFFMVAGLLLNESAQAIDPETRVTTTGAVFTRDTSNAFLGEAWRDPSGLIWDDLVKRADGTVHYMKHVDAIKYCTSIGAHLPSKNDFIRLWEYMGGDLNSAQILPNLSGYWFWSSSVDTSFILSYFAYGFFDGHIDSYHRHLNLAVRCVVDR